MASTNKTINYNLSQYVANDKPTYLVDYNSDMNKIDTQMKANSDLAGLAKTEADDLSSRVDGQDVIIGNLNTTVGQHTNDINSLNTDVSEVNTKVGDLTDLNTTDKTDIVSAVNEVNTKVGDLTDLDTTDKSNIVNAINEVKGDLVDTYSTTETKTNKIWIDGKPIYRKVFVINKSETTSNAINISTNIQTIENIVRQTGIIVRNDQTTFDVIPCNLTNADFEGFFGDSDTSTIRVRMGNSLYSVLGKVIVILEYTKVSI